MTMREIDSLGSVVTPFLRKREASEPALLPVDDSVEQALLGAVLLRNDCFHSFSSFLQPEHFAIPVHQRIYRKLRELLDAGRRADAVLLKAVFDNDADLAELDGGGYLADLIGAAVSTLSAPDYAAQIFDAWLKRQAIAVSEIAREAAADGARTGAELVDELEAQLQQLRQGSAVDDQTVTIGDALSRQIERIDRAQRAEGGVPGITTGIRALNAALGGLHRGHLVVIGGRPSMGKTALALSVAVNAAWNNYRVLFLSLEMQAEELGARLLARKTRICTQAQMQPMSDESFRELMQAQQDLASLPLLIDDADSVTVEQIASRARRHKRLGGLDVLFIDYLGLINATDPRQSPVYQIAHITKTLKRLAKELDIAVVLLAQLSRRVEERDDKRPLMADLRDSGSIEQDADVIMFPYRHEYYLKRSPPRKEDFRKSGKQTAEEAYLGARADFEKALADCEGLAEVIIPKCRQGKTGTETLRFDGVRQVFEDR